MKNRKIVCFLLVLILLVAAVLATGCAKIGGDGVVYELNYNKDKKRVFAKVVDYKGNGEHVTIAKRYCGFPVISISRSAFYKNENIRSVTIPETVVYIAEDAFGFCTKLTSVTIPKSVESIDYLAFVGCHHLVEIVNYSQYANIAIPDTVIAFYNRQPFYGTKLTNDNDYIIYNDGEDKILVGYFGEDKEIVVPSYVTKINAEAFYQCKDIKSVVLPSGLKSIGARAFQYCESLQSIVIPQGTTMGADVFYGSSNLSIYCEASSQPDNWDVFWNGVLNDSRPTYWAGEWHYDTNGNPVPNN